MLVEIEPYTLEIEISQKQCESTKFENSSRRFVLKSVSEKYTNKYQLKWYVA